jgi:hypothetical protein
MVWYGLVWSGLILCALVRGRGSNK